VISNVLTLAPAGVLGSGSADARPYACDAVRPAPVGVIAAVRGTGLPAAVLPTPTKRFAGTGIGTALPTCMEHLAITQNDGTTPLGDHSSGRPLS
jgi:hypothetical protein